MKRRTFLGALIGSLLAAPLAAESLQATKVWRIGFLTSGTREGAGADIRIAPFTQGLRELGYRDGRNISLETATRRAESSGFLRSRPSWSISRSTSWLRHRPRVRSPPSRRPARSPSSWLPLESLSK